MSMMIPISTLFIGLNGLIALILSYIVAMERGQTKVWHGESKDDILMQPDPLENPNIVAGTVENLSQKFLPTKIQDDGALQRKVSAHGNFSEYVPIALFFLIALELMSTQTWLVWLEGGLLTIARIAHAYGLIKTYGPSPGRAIGFLLTWLVYIIGSLACLYYGVKTIII